MCRRSVKVNLDNGLHLVPCSQIARTAGMFACDVRILKDDASVDAKVIFDLMTLTAEKGTELVIEASGEDAMAAVEAVANLFDNNFADESS